MEEGGLAHYASCNLTVPRLIHWSVGHDIEFKRHFLEYCSRANIGNAKVLGLTNSIHLTNNEYNLALSIFFIGYVLYETPSNILLKKFSPRWYIPIMTVCDPIFLPILESWLFVAYLGFGLRSVCLRKHCIWLDHYSIFPWTCWGRVLARNYLLE